MNTFNITVNSEPFYPQNHYGAPVVIVDDIKLEPKTVSTQIDVQAPMHVLKDIAAKQLSKTIIESMSHTSISNQRENTYCERFSFTYATKDQLDIISQKLDNRTKDLYITQNKLDLEQSKNLYLNKQIDIRNYALLGLSIIIMFLYAVRYL